jgi:hypothetical protein
MVAHIQALFPRLATAPFRVTSEHDSSYNCIAWAAGVTNQWWWPLGEAAEAYWPDGVPRARTLEAFHAALATLGYSVCTDEPGVEKVALFADAHGLPTHAARQLANGHGPVNSVRRKTSNTVCRIWRANSTGPSSSYCNDRRTRPRRQVHDMENFSVSEAATAADIQVNVPGQASLTCRLRPKAVMGRQGPIPYIGEVELANCSPAPVEIAYTMTPLQFLDLEVMGPGGQVVSTGHFSDRFSPAREPAVLRLMPGEKFTANVPLLATLPRDKRLAGRYTVQASYRLNDMRILAEPLTVELVNAC